MKKVRFCLAAAIVSLALLSGCGMARDGYIEDHPSQTIAPTENPVVTSTPRPAKKPSQKDKTEDPAVEQTPFPDAQQTDTPNM